MPRAITTALPGDVFTRLTVVEEAERGRNGARRVLVRCSCGSEPKINYVGDLTQGRVRSCGCLRFGAKKRAAEDPKPEPVTRDPFRGSGGKVAPVVVVFRSDDIRMVTVSCPFCRAEHDHAMPDDVLPTAGLIRTSKCSGRTGGLYAITGVPGVGEEAA